MEAHPDSPDHLTAEQLLRALTDLRSDVHAEGTHIYEGWQQGITRESFHHSARNLAYYLALRTRDLRALQAELPLWGLSSLGRSEARVLENLDAVIATLRAIIGRPEDQTWPGWEAFTRGARTLAANSETLLGPRPDNRRVRILVTLPTEAGDPETGADFLADLLRRGMNAVRINCAHDTPEVWQAMIDNLHVAEASTGRECRILMDLGGPKVRTGKIHRLHGKKHAHRGDHILITPSEAHTPDDAFIAAHNLAFWTWCTIPQAITQVEQGARVWFDDGAIGAKVEATTPQGLVMRVTHASPDGTRFRRAKGINFPDTWLKLSPLTEKDITDLDFVVRHADAVDYSFVQERDDILLLQTEIDKRLPTRDNPRPLAIIAKIETRLAVINLPELIAAAASKHPFGVMIARGDLAVEIGYERLAEMQEQILWICEAAHIPVIWATQVLESYAKTGIPSRAEVTDAAMSERAECVMLNKGPFIPEVVTMLDDVLTRMGAHQVKKTAQLRELRSWQYELDE